MTSVIERFGALGVFALMVPESACIPVPSEVTLLFSGFAVHQGWMSLPLAVLAATAGNVVGSLVAYALGASHLPQRLPLVRGVLHRWEGLIDERGTSAIFVARLVPLARTFISLPAGARHVRLVPFVTLTILGCALWAFAFVLTGVLVAGAWANVNAILGRILLAAGVLAIMLSVIRRGKHRA